MQISMEADMNSAREGFEHAPTKGDATEKVWIDFLRKNLPKRYCVDKAFVIDHQNHISEQIDLVIYDSQYSHLVFEANENRYVTAESVYAVFEVKQDFTKTNTNYALKKIKSVRELNRTSIPIVSANGLASPKPLHNIISGILTYDSSLEKTFHNLAIYNISEKGMDLICCLKRGAYSSVLASENDNSTNEQNVDNIIFAEDNTLLFFFFELLKKLQAIGTVPAIDISKYEDSISQKSLI